jgi:hypothetical protein
MSTAPQPAAPQLPYQPKPSVWTQMAEAWQRFKMGITVLAGLMLLVLGINAWYPDIMGIDKTKDRPGGPVVAAPPQPPPSLSLDDSLRRAEAGELLVQLDSIVAEESLFQQEAQPVLSRLADRQLWGNSAMAYARVRAFKFNPERVAAFRRALTNVMSGSADFFEAYSVLNRAKIELTAARQRLNMARNDLTFVRFTVPTH